MSLVSYFELYLDEGISCLRFGTGPWEEVRERERSRSRICCYTKIPKDSREVVIRQGLAKWDDIAGALVRMEHDPLMDHGVPLSFYQEARALMNLAENYVDAGKKFPSSGRWVVFTLNGGHVFPISEDDVWTSLNSTEDQRYVYMAIHGSHDEIAMLLKEIQESADDPT
jgi:hypothetical protein